LNTLFLLILAHILADFPLQTDRINAEKSRYYWWGYTKHLIIIFLTLIVLLLPYFRPELVVAFILFSLAHMMVDVIKNFFSARGKTDLAIFLVDQGIHFLMIYIFWGIMDFPLNPQVQTVGDFLLFPKAVEVWELFFQGVSVEKTLLTINIYALIIYGGAVFTKKVLNLPLFDLENEGSVSTGQGVMEIKKVGYYLGMLERALIITFTVLNSLSAVAFIFTAKSIARFKELNQKDFAEYYLTGTLLSVFLGIIGGVSLRYLLSCIL